MTENTSNNKLDYQPPYGDLTEINSYRLILDSLGKNLLIDIVSDYLNVLGTSAAIYEKNGDYALGIFSSGWCQFLDRMSRELCCTSDNKEALQSGKWLCHESCWTQASKVTLETRQPVDIECWGGIRLFAVPIVAGQEVVGSMNFGYGTPPKQKRRLLQIASEFGTTVDELSVRAKAYKPRTLSTIETCKKQLLTAARLVGLVIENERLQELARSNEEWFSTTIRSIGDAVISTDINALVRFMNPIAQALTGWSEKDAIGKPLRDVFTIFNEESGKQAEVPLDKILREGFVSGLANHTLLIAKDGTRRSIDDSGAPIKTDDKGTITGAVFVFRDVTEKRNLERDLIERVKEITCLYAIAELVERAGITLDEIYQETVRLLPPGWQYPDVTCAQMTISGNEYKTANYGETKWTLSADINVYGEKAGTLKVGYLYEKPSRDEGPFLYEERSLIDAVAMRLGRITERLRSEQRLKRINRLLLAIRNINQLTTRESDVSTMLKGICDNLVETTLCYHSWFVLLDQTLKVIAYGQAGVGEDFSAIIDRARVGDLPTCCQKALRQAEVVVTENPQLVCRECMLSQRCANGVGLVASLKYGDKSYGLLCVSLQKEILSDTDAFMLLQELINDIFIALRNLEDISERKRAEEELRQRTVELEMSNKELEAFSYSVSHDLRAPLRSMDGFSTALLEDYADKLDDQGKQYLRHVQESSELMGKLIDDLLKLARVTRSDMNQETVNLSEMAQKVVAELEQARPGQKLTANIAPNIMAYGDRSLLLVVLENLLGNAWKFSSKVDSPQIEMGITEYNGKQAYFVRDNGVGFDMDYADKLFKPFQRLHKTTEFAGTGIGLANVQRIVHRHRGEVWAESKVGEGATFYFTLG